MVDGELFHKPALLEIALKYVEEQHAMDLHRYLTAELEDSSVLYSGVHGRRCKERNCPPHALETAYRVSARGTVCGLILLCGLASPARTCALFSGEKKLNNL